MLQRLLALTALSAAVATTSAMKVHVRIHHSHHARAADTPSPAPTEDSSSESAAASTSGSGSESESAAGEADSDVWSFSPVRSIQARVQGNAPTWDTKTKTWVASFGKTYDEQFRSVLDTVNTASVEGALMYVQAEGINVKEQSVKCQRKNKMQYIVFYDISVVQPNASIAFYGEKHSTPEYCPFVAMDGGKCTPAGDDIPDTCKQFDGIGGQPKLGHCVGANEQVSDKRAPYPGNYWFSYPNSCVTQGWSNKTDECRAQYPGGLCPVGVKPDGVTCSFQYSILGYLNIDDLVGITDGSGTPDNKAYVNYTAFCNAGGVEFSADNNGQGFENVKSIPFWANPGDETANEGRTASMIELYNKIAPDAEIGTMLPLPDIDDLTGKNPSCYENNPTCATTPHGCRRILYSQVCEICEEQADDCVKAPSGYKFPSLEVPKAEKNASGSSSGSSSGNGSTIGTPSPSTSASSLAVVSSTAVAIGAVVAALL